MNNNLFNSARIKLTAWYLVIIMCISVLFSIVIYAGINSELERFDRFQRARQERLEQGLRNIPIPVPQFDAEIISQARSRLIVTLGFINFGILVISGLAGYFLAGRTLRPIQVMLDEQNRFITDASHELKTPLTALRSEIEVYLRGKKHTIAEADTILSSNLEEVVSLQSLSENLIRLTTYQKNVGLVEEVSLLSIIEDSFKRITPLAKRKHIIIDNKIDDKTLIGDKLSLTELFTILLDNAIKYSPKHTKVTLILTDMSVHIVDQGIGIDEKDIPHIFDRFYRADRSRSKTEVAGYGLGLSIAKQIVDDHKGSISVESKIGQGTTFTIQLPLKNV